MSLRTTIDIILKGCQTTTRDHPMSLDSTPWDTKEVDTLYQLFKDIKLENLELQQANEQKHHFNSYCKTIRILYVCYLICTFNGINKSLVKDFI